jgi:vacuolar-type H+-ATPase subunit C/Vma6
MTKTSRYAAALAKIGAERGKLLSEPQLKALTESKSLDEMAERLRGSNYGDEIMRLKTPRDVGKVDHAIKDSLLETLRKIVVNSPKSVQPFLRTYLEGYEVQNLKTQIKLTAAGLTTEEKLAKMHLRVEAILDNLDAFEKAANAESLEALVKVFEGTEYSDALELGLNRYADLRSTWPFDLLLDRAFYDKVIETFQRLPRTEHKHVRFYASLQTDGFVLLTILRGKILGYAPESLRTAIPHGTFDILEKEVEALIIAQDFDAAMKIAQQTRYKEYFQKASSPEETLAGAERAIKKAILDHAHAMRFTDVFNAGAPIAFMVQKEAEATNLLTISLGIDNMQKSEGIWHNLLFPD